MISLINNESSCYPLEEEEGNSERTTFGEKFAVAMVGLLTVSALLIGTWSAFIYLTGNTDNGGPLRKVVSVLQGCGIL